MRVLQIGSDRSKRGSIVSSSPSFERQEAYARSFGTLDDISFTLRSDGFKPYKSALRSVYPTNSANRLIYLFDALRIARTLEKPDVVSAQDPFEAGFVGWLIARRLRVPLHVQVHTDFLSPQYVAHSFINRIRVRIAGFVLRRAAHVRVVSGRIKESIETRYHVRAPISVLPIFVDLEQFRRALPDLQLVERFGAFSSKILVVSRLEPEKNVELALKSFDASAPSASCLIIVGEGDLREKLEAFARSLKSAGQIFFEGAQNPAPYYKLADLVLFPSHYDGYGLVIVEALAAGKPVISTDVGIAREAGAIAVKREKFAGALSKWFASGPRTGELKNYPYKSFDEYVRAYTEDLASCIVPRTR